MAERQEQSVKREVDGAAIDKAPKKPCTGSTEKNLGKEVHSEANPWCKNAQTSWSLETVEGDDDALDVEKIDDMILSKGVKYTFGEKLKDIERFFYILVLEKGFSLGAQRMCLGYDYFQGVESEESEDDELIRVNCSAMSQGYISQILIAAQQCHHAFGRRQRKIQCDLGDIWQDYRVSDDDYHIDIHFFFNGKRVAVTVHSWLGDRYVHIYARD